MSVTRRKAATDGSSFHNKRSLIFIMIVPLLFLSALVIFQLLTYARFREFSAYDKIIMAQQLNEQSATTQSLSSPQMMMMMMMDHDDDGNASQVATVPLSPLTLRATNGTATNGTATTTTTTDNSVLFENGFSFYYPKLRDASYFDNDKAWNDVPYLHILETPLIQNQLNLTLLIESRLKLFQTFCLPTIRQQTSRNFIWIVRVDTRLSAQQPAWLRQLIQWLKHDERFYLVERDSNPPWRHGQATQQLAQSRVYTGNVRRLEYFMSAYDKKHILETRIDGDDGLHYQYMEYIANRSMQILAHNPPPAFFYWCVAQELEWHPVFLARRPGPFLETQNTTPIDPLLVPHSPYTHGLWMPGPVYQDLCPTPGITRVYPLGTPTDVVFRIGHHELWRKFKYRKASCQRPEDDHGSSPWKELNCTAVVRLDTPFPALRSRTPTSASMVTVGGLNYGHLRTHYQRAHEYWNLTAYNFGLDAEQVRAVQTHVVDNLLEISQEGLAGQCSFRHSCMENARKRLVEIIQKANQTRIKQAG